MSLVPNNSLALLIIFLFKPNFSDMANAFDLPGMPIKSLYVGFKVSKLNSNAPFSTQFFDRAYLLSSG